jgi:GT2 family glycosyltransferase
VVHSCFAKSTALKALPDSRGNIGFEESFYMYKEDIELSLRLGKQWGIKVFTDLKAYHCRGWGQGIQTLTGLVNIQLRMIYILVYYKLRALPYAILKYLYVMLLEKK